MDIEHLPTFPRVRTLLLLIGGFFGIGFLLYGWSLHNEFVRWDDGMLIYENPVIRQINPSTLKWIFTHFDPELYIPLTFFTYQIDYLISGVHPFLYHLDNLVLHILNALLVMFLCFALFKRKAIALFCGLLFLMHPLNTEAVEWASGRKDVLSTFFLLASIASYFFYRDQSSRRWYIASLLLFLCGLLSKVMIITLPIVLLLLDYARMRKMDRAFFLDKVPYLALSILFGLIGILGKEQVIGASSFSEKFLMAFKSMVFYMQQYLWPAKFSLLYPYNGTITALSPDFFVPIFIICALLLCAILLRNRYRLVTVGIFFYCVTVAPTLLNFAKGEMDLYFASDRYAYVPQIGLIILLVSFFLLIGNWLKKFIQDQMIDRAGMVIGLILLCTLGTLSYRLSLVWKNTQSLFQNVITQYPDASYVAYNNLCNAERLADHLELAVEDCTKSLAVRPHPKTYSNLGAIYRKQKNFADAIDVYQKAIALDAQSPYPYFGIGIVYAERGQFDLAEAAYQKAIGLKPNYADVYVNLGALYAATGEYTKAAEQYKKALSYNSFSTAALYNAGIADAELGKTESAMQFYAQALAVDSSLVAARINLALLLYKEGNGEAAIAQFRAVLRTDPENATAHSALQQLGEE